MKTEISKNALRGLHWSVGLVVLAESVLFAFGAAQKRGFTHTGSPDWFQVVLAGAEIVAVLLFLVSPAVVIGGYLLLVIFAVAVLVHVLHGWWDVGSLIVYAMAVLVILSGKTQKHQGS